MNKLLTQAITEAVKQYPDITAHLSDNSLMFLVADGMKQINRDPFENSLYSDIAKFFKISLRELYDMLGGTWDLTKIDETYWRQYAEGLQGTIEPNLSTTAYDSGLHLQEETGIFIDYDIYSEEVARWAERYTFDLVRGLTDTTRTRLQAAVPSFFSEGLTRDELERRILESGIPDLDVYIGDRVRRIYSDQRASMIAVTETTRAASLGEQVTAKQIMMDNPSIVMTPIWNTSNDELVCPICGPRNGKEIKPGNETNGEYPPAHPNCRCWVSHEATVK